MKRIELTYKSEPEAPRPLFRVWSEDDNKYFAYPYYMYNGMIEDKMVWDGCTIERATGMTDTNGVEIYEGDIVDIVEFDYWSRREVGLVTYRSEFATFRVELSGGGPVQLFARDPVVLGNIHENSELMEVGE